jgi:hypothetical protein
MMMIILLHSPSSLSLSTMLKKTKEIWQLDLLLENKGKGH